MIEVKNIGAIVTDVEGTTTSISFIKDVLFPYARERIPDYVRDNELSLFSLLNEVRDRENNGSFTTEDIIDILMRWMDEDRKITTLKTLQGMIWKEGYDSGQLKGHIYDDALRALQSWRNSGKRIYIYSSGSETAQKLLFGHTKQGDLTPFFTGYFDTTVGAKVESSSYGKIAGAIGLPPEKILFLSDHEGEIAAAGQAGLQVILVDRDGIKPGSLRNFDDIKLLEKAA